MQCYLALNQAYTTADYLSTVTDLQLKPTLTKSRLSEHSLAIETGRLPAEQRLCCHCSLNEPETELHFLTKCEKFKYIREIYFPKFEMVTKGSFSELSDEEKLPVLLGEESKSSKLAAVYVSACHTERQRGTHRVSADTHIYCLLFCSLLMTLNDIYS